MRTRTTNFKVESAAYHRNGVGGEGFYIGIAHCVVEGGSGSPTRMLVTFFPEYKDGEPCPAGKDADGEYHNGRVAVVDLDLAATGQVDMGRNSWRGDNFYEVADAIVRSVRYPDPARGPDRYSTPSGWSR